MHLKKNPGMRTSTLLDLQFRLVTLLSFGLHHPKQHKSPHSKTLQPEGATYSIILGGRGKTHKTRKI